MSASKEIEENLEFLPKFGDDGLITAISQDATTGEVLMVAYMNREALDETIEKNTYELVYPNSFRISPDRL